MTPGTSGLLLLLASAALNVVFFADASSRLDVIDLPVGFRPEGITKGEEWDAFVGSTISENSHPFYRRTGVVALAVELNTTHLFGLYCVNCSLGSCTYRKYAVRFSLS